MSIPVINYSGEVVKTIDLPEIFEKAEISQGSILRVIHWQRSCMRSGNHAVKGRSDVNATRKKAFRQKGTGSARRGSKTTNILRGGGVSHGPVVRDHGYVLPKAIKKSALRSIIKSKLDENNLIVIDNTDCQTHKTKDFAEKMRNLALKSALIVDNEFSNNTLLSTKNIHAFDCIKTVGLNVLSIMSKQTLILSLSSIEELEKRCL